jgi:tRNA pseudouridine38-40 synthase
LSVLQSKDRKHAGPTAEPQGLYFVKAYYHDF